MPISESSMDTSNSNNRVRFSESRGPPEAADGLLWTASMDRDASVYIGDSKVGLLGRSSFPYSATVALCILAGLLLGGVVFLWMFFVLQLEWILCIAISAGFGLVCIVSFAISKPLRCAAAVSLASLTLTEGLAFMLGLGFAIILAGPVSNILYNTEQMVNSGSCLSALLRNETQAFHDMMNTPMAFVEDQLDQAQSQWNVVGTQVDAQIGQLDGALDSVNSEMDQLTNKVDSISQSCHKKVLSVRNTCSKKFNVLKKRCEDMFGVFGGSSDNGNTGNKASDHSLTRMGKAKMCEKFGMYCNEFERRKRSFADICSSLDVSPVCDNILQVDNLCQQVHTPSLMQSFKESAASVHNRSLWFRNALDFKLTKKINEKMGTKIGVPENETTPFRRSTAERLKPKLRIVVIGLRVMESLASLSFLILFYHSFLYAKDYIISDKYDNNYINNQFRAFDRSQIPAVLLPLQGYELRKYRSIESVQISFTQVLRGLLIWVMNFIIAMLFFGLDDALIHFLLYLKRQSGRIDLTFVNSMGMASFEVDPQSTGMIADFFRKFLGGFNQVIDPNLGDRIQFCVNDPVPLSRVHVYVGLVIYLIVFIACIIDGEGNRWRNMVCSWFYPKRANERAMALYKRISKDRAKGAEYVKRKTEDKLVERARRDAVSLMTRRKPNSTDKNSILDKCLICGKNSIRSERTTCSTCGAMYCAACWRAHGNKCPACDF